MFAVHMVSPDVFLGVLMIVIGAGIYYLRKFLQEHGEVGDVAKKVITDKAIDIISKLTKK